MKYHELFDPSKASFVDNLIADQILKFLNIAKVNYYNALSISPASDYEVHLRRLQNSCSINTFNPIMLKAWKANQSSITTKLFLVCQLVSPDQNQKLHRPSYKHAVK